MEVENVKVWEYDFDLLTELLSCSIIGISLVWIEQYIYVRYIKSLWKRTLIINQNVKSDLFRLN